MPCLILARSTSVPLHSAIATPAALDFDRGVAPLQRRFCGEEDPPDRPRAGREGHIGPVGRAADARRAEAVVVGGRRLQAGDVLPRL